MSPGDLSRQARRAGSRSVPRQAYHEATRRHVPTMPLNADTFTKQHVAIHRGRFEESQEADLYLNNPETPEGRLRMSEVINPTVEEFLYHLQRVGSEYGWDRRKKYQPGNREYLDRLLGKDGTRLFLFQINGSGREAKDIGFCLVTPVTEEEGFKTKSYKTGAPKQELVGKYRAMHHLPHRMADNAIEIYKFGLYPEATGKGYGNYYLGEMLRILIERDGFDIVYLDTRDTNHGGVVKFYKQNGMEHFFEELMPSDLVESAPDHPRPVDPAAGEVTVASVAEQPRPGDRLS